MRRSIAAIRPDRIVLVEGEVWPNLIALAARKNIPVALVNARLSPRSWRRFKRARFAVRPLFARLRFIAVPEKADVERWRILAGDDVEISQTGSVKYDPDDSAAAASRSRQIFEPSALVLFGGSTHHGEEIVLAKIFRDLKASLPSLKLFLAPRHVERARDVAHDIANLGLETVLLSSLDGNLPGDADCVILDRTGELAGWYQIATLVFIGKSLLAHGGQNPVEAVVAGVPVVFGSHMENFAALARAMVERKGAVQVNDEPQLRRAIEALLKNPAARAGLVAEAKSVIGEHRGATRRTAELIAKLHSRPGGDVPSAANIQGGQDRTCFARRSVIYENEHQNRRWFARRWNLPLVDTAVCTNYDYGNDDEGRIQRIRPRVGDSGREKRIGHNSTAVCRDQTDPGC